MATETDDLPPGLNAYRFLRITLTIGMVGGQEKTIQYDKRGEYDDGEIRYRKYIERHADTQPDISEGDDLADEVGVADELKAHEQDISYTTKEATETMYLVSWNYGEDIHIMDEPTFETTVDAARTLHDRPKADQVEGTHHNQPDFNEATDDDADDADDEADAQTA